MANPREPTARKSAPPARARLPNTRGWLVALAALGLLWALGAVVTQAVQQAHARHAHTAARADATWRCNNLAGRDEREGCRQRASGMLVGAAAVSR